MKSPTESALLLCLAAFCAAAHGVTAQERKRARARLSAGKRRLDRAGFEGALKDFKKKIRAVERANRAA